MNQKFQAVVHHRDDVAYVKLSGVIDEDNELAELTDRIGQGTTVIDLGEIERINSCGVRDWVNWLSKIEKNGAKPVLVECSPAIVAQINLVNNFTGSGVVKSFFAPYFCPQCDLEKVLLVETQEMMGQEPPRAPTCRCDECDGVMDFDDMEESYFAFLVQMKNKMLSSPKIEAVVAEFTPTDGERKIRSRVGSTGGGIGTGTGSSLPSVPSLPQMSRGGSTGAGSLQAAASGGGGVPVNSGSIAPSGSFRNSPGTGSGVKGFGGGGSHRSGVGSFGGGTGSGIGSGSRPGGLPINIVNPVGYSAPVASSSKSKWYGALVVVLLVVAIGLLTYAVFFAGKQPQKVKIGRASSPAATRTIGSS